MSKHYAKKDEDFARLLREPLSVGFRPRFHLIYTEREAEQDAYFWFLQGQLFMREESLRVMGIEPSNQTQRTELR